MTFDPTAGNKGWFLIGCCPRNKRVLVQNQTEIAMAWLDRMDERFYYAPQGGLVHWEPTHWSDIPEGPAP